MVFSGLSGARHPSSEILLTVPLNNWAVTTHRPSEEQIRATSWLLDPLPGYNLSENGKPSSLAGHLAQRGNGMSWSEAHRKLVLVSAADHCSLVGIFSDPDHPFGIHKDFQAVHIFKHYKLHDASFCHPWAPSSPRGPGDCTNLQLDRKEGSCC